MPSETYRVTGCPINALKAKSVFENAKEKIPGALPDITGATRRHGKPAGQTITHRKPEQGRKRQRKAQKGRDRIGELPISVFIGYRMGGDSIVSPSNLGWRQYSVTVLPQVETV